MTIKCSPMCSRRVEPCLQKPWVVKSVRITSIAIGAATLFVGFFALLTGSSLAIRLGALNHLGATFHAGGGIALMVMGIAFVTLGVLRVGGDPQVEEGPDLSSIPYHSSISEGDRSFTFFTPRPKTPRNLKALKEILQKGEEEMKKNPLREKAWACETQDEIDEMCLAKPDGELGIFLNCRSIFLQIKEKNPEVLEQVRVRNFGVASNHEQTYIHFAKYLFILFGENITIVGQPDQDSQTPMKANYSGTFPLTILALDEQSHSKFPDKSTLVAEFGDLKDKADLYREISRMLTAIKKFFVETLPSL